VELVDANGQWRDQRGRGIVGVLGGRIVVCHTYRRPGRTQHAARVQINVVTRVPVGMTGVQRGDHREHGNDGENDR